MSFSLMNDLMIFSKSDLYFLLWRTHQCVVTLKKKKKKEHIWAILFDNINHRDLAPDRGFAENFL